MNDIANFDYRREKLDVCERYIRDVLELKIESWARFRRRIQAAVEAKKYLRPKESVDISKDVEDSYRDMGKSNYQIITNLGDAFEQWRCASAQEKTVIGLCNLAYKDPTAGLEYGRAYLRFNRAVYSFYNHLVSILDGVSRLIFIIFDADSAIKKRPFGDEELFVRKRISWDLLVRGYKKLCQKNDFEYFIKDDRLEEIARIRNQLTHAWKIPHSISQNGAAGWRWCWPDQAKSERWVRWPYREPEPGEKEYHYILPLVDLARDYFRYVENLLDKNVFPDLLKGVPQWEQNNGVEIREA